MIAAAASLLTLFMPQVTPPALELAPLFQSHMVLQRSAQAPVWGRGAPGATVVVEASWAEDARASAVVDARGEWRVALATPEAGGPHRITVRGDVERVLEDVLVGEVWLCSGQSNMEWALAPGPLGGVLDWQKEIARADHPRIRHFDTPNTVAHSEQRACGGTWEPCTPASVGRFSAVAYFFARELERELDVPVGLIHSSWSGTPIQSWMPADVARRFEPCAPSLAQVERARAASPELTREQQLGYDPQLPPVAACVLFNAMVAPHAPYALRGFLWYQGEADRSLAPLYDTLQIALMESWRTRFAVPQAPFYFVQIAPFLYEGDRGETGALREAQRRVLRTPNTGMAVTLDVGDPQDIHPRNKQDVGKRLARWALNRTYGRTEVVASGPLVREVVRDGAKVRVSFDELGGGLISAADHLEGFELVDAAGAVFKARAELDGDSVLLWRPECPEPVFAQYGYGAAMQPVLFNKAWLPAAAFRLPVAPAKAQAK